jgi:spermidine synthase
MRRLAVVLCFAAIAGVAAAGGEVDLALGSLVYSKDSLYHRILVYQSGSVVTLRFGTHGPVLLQSQVDTNDLPRHVQEYSTLAFCGLLYQPQPARALVLGLGGGVIPRELRHYYPQLQIDVAEIDPDIPPVAERFFGFRQDQKLVVHVSDGRMFIKKQQRLNPPPKYDLIVLDAFSGDYIPFHLMTKEFLEEARGILAPGGVVVANVFYDNRLFDAEVKTFTEVFPRCQAFFGVWTANAMIVAGGPNVPVLTAQDAATRAAALQAANGFTFDMRTVAARLRPGFAPEPRARVLTDDQAPVNTLRWQEAAR